MIFKNLSIYRLGQKVDVSKFGEHLDSCAFVPVREKELESLGFGTLFGMDQRVYREGSCHLFCLVNEVRKADTGAVKTAVDRRVQQLEDERNERIKARERRAIKEEIKEKMTREAAPKASELWAYIDNESQLLVINTASAKKADMMVSSIREGLGFREVYPLRPQHSLRKRITAWVYPEGAPEGIVFGETCHISLQDAAITYTRNELDDENLRDYIMGGYVVDKIQLLVDENSSFTLTDDFVIRSFRLSDICMEDYDAGTGDPLEVIGADIKIMSSSVNALVVKLIDNLGGEEVSG